MANMRSTILKQGNFGRPAQPNDLDFKRIERSLESRKRYRYVTPILLRTAGGYRIQSPCCSRNIDPDGGVVDIALLLFDDRNESWRLLRKNHDLGTWELDSIYERLAEVLRYLNDDPERRFWQ
jgi:hypothetical protein